MSKRSKRKIILKNLKSHKTIWHPESTLVYKSRKERIVIGRYVDKEFISLDEKALELCDEWKMKPDESLIEEDNEDESESNVGEDHENTEEEKCNGEAHENTEEDKCNGEAHENTEEDKCNGEAHENTEEDKCNGEAHENTEEDKCNGEAHENTEEDKCNGEAHENNEEDKSRCSQSSLTTSSVNITGVISKYNSYSKSFLSDLEKWYTDMESKKACEIAVIQKEYDDLKIKYDAIKKKFDIMKSLFQ